MVASHKEEEEPLGLATYTRDWEKASGDVELTTGSEETGRVFNCEPDYIPP